MLRFASSECTWNLFLFTRIQNLTRVICYEIWKLILQNLRKIWKCSCNGGSFWQNPKKISGPQQWYLTNFYPSSIALSLRDPEDVQASWFLDKHFFNNSDPIPLLSWTQNLSRRDFSTFRERIITFTGWLGPSDPGCMRGKKKICMEINNYGKLLTLQDTAKFCMHPYTLDTFYDCTVYIERTLEHMGWKMERNDISASWQKRTMSAERGRD